MKIIGKAEGGKFLVSASADELARLGGDDSDWYRHNNGKGHIEVGTEIDVNLIYNHLNRMQGAAEEVRRARGIIDTVASGLLSAETLIEKVMTDPKPEKPQEG